MDNEYTDNAYNTTDNIHIDMESGDSDNESMDGGSQKNIETTINIYKNLAEIVEYMFFDEDKSLRKIIEYIPSYGDRNPMKKLVENYEQKISEPINNIKIKNCISTIKSRYDDSCAKKLNEVLEAADKLRKFDSSKYNNSKLKFPPIGFRFKKSYSKKDIGELNKYLDNIQLIRERSESTPVVYTPKAYTPTIDYRKSAQPAYTPTKNPSGYPTLPKLSPKQAQPEQSHYIHLPKFQPDYKRPYITLPPKTETSQPTPLFPPKAQPMPQFSPRTQSYTEYRPLPAPPQYEEEMTVTPGEKCVKHLAESDQENRELGNELQKERNTIKELEKQLENCNNDKNILAKQLGMNPGIAIEEGESGKYSDVQGSEELYEGIIKDEDEDYGGGSSENYENYDEIYYRNKMNYLNLKNK